MLSNIICVKSSTESSTIFLSKVSAIVGVGVVSSGKELKLESGGLTLASE